MCLVPQEEILRYFPIMMKDSESPCSRYHLILPLPFSYREGEGQEYARFPVWVIPQIWDHLPWNECQESLLWTSWQKWKRSKVILYRFSVFRQVRDLAFLIILSVCLCSLFYLHWHSRVLPIWGGILFSKKQFLHSLILSFLFSLGFIFVFLLVFFLIPFSCFLEDFVFVLFLIWVQGTI